jgi:hypothetical protein
MAPETDRPDQWGYLFESASPTPVHVYPTFGEPHEVEGAPCWCSPEIEEDGRLVIHREAN